MIILNNKNLKTWKLHFNTPNYFWGVVAIEFMSLPMASTSSLKVDSKHKALV